MNREPGEWRTGELDWMYRAMRLARELKVAKNRIEANRARAELDAHIEVVPA